MQEGLIFNIARYAIHDGPGIRTTVFFKGCPGRCLWCSNPESQTPAPEYIVKDGKTERIGRWVAPEALLEEVMRDYPFWRRSGGGVTLSGGEPLAQPQFAQEFLALCKVRNVHTAIETCLFCGSKLLDDVVQYVDYVQFDMKEMDPARHKELTGLDNDIILENAARLLAGDKALLVRLPYIPGCNDSEDNLRALGRFLESRRPGVQLELLPYHRMGVGRYEGLGMTYLLPDTKPPTKEDVADAADILSEYSVNVFTEGDE